MLSNAGCQGAFAETGDEVTADDRCFEEINLEKLTLEPFQRDKLTKCVN